MKYKHPQIGIAMIMIMALMMLLLVYASISKPNEPIGVIFVIVAVVTILFSTLTIQVDKEKIVWFFGPKFWSKSIDIAEIESAQQIRTKWYYGLGIKLIATGWLYNVSGLTAIEIKLKDGTTISLGTKDPENLVNAINQ